MRFRFKVLLMLAALTILWCAPERLPAAESCRISVETILASSDDTVVDGRLKQHIGELQSMFKFTSYRLLSSESLDLNMGQSGTLSLPGERRLTVTPRSIQGDRADISLQMIRREATVFRTQIQILNRGNLFVGGPNYLNGNLIFRIYSAY